MNFMLGRHRAFKAVSLNGLLVNIELLYPWQQRHMLVTLPFEALLLSYLVHCSFIQTAVQSLLVSRFHSGCHDNCVTIVTRYVADAYCP